ncbi:MAG: flagellar basal body-associated FliL family protein [Terriglobia bacterium]
MADAPRPEPKSAGSRKFLAGVVIIVCLGIGAGGFWFGSHRGLASSKPAKKNSSAVVEANAPPVTIFPLVNFIVNLADPNQSAFLRLGVTLGLSKRLPAGGEDAKTSPYTPQIRDVVLNILSSWSSEELLAPGGRAKLKSQLLVALQQKLPEMEIQSIYFTDFLIQQ